VLKSVKVFCSFADVSASVLGERSRAVGNFAKFLWLEELRSKTWNREDLRQQLFREREVTREHYYALQDRLRQKFPDRDSEQYNGYLNKVLSEKLDILQLTNPAEALSPWHPEDRKDDDDSVIHTLFPYTLKYLDLSILKLQEKSNRFPSPLLLRQEYDHISKLIDNGPRSGDGSVILSGQPGTGEPFVSPSRRI